MKSFRAFIVKEFFHILRDKRTVLILFGMPVIQMVLFGFAIRNEINDARIAILDHAHDIRSQEITQKILSSGYFQNIQTLTHDDQIAPAFETGDVKMVVVFEPQFTTRLYHEGVAYVQLITDATEPNMATTLTAYATSIIRDYSTNLNPQAPTPMITEVKMLFNPEMRSVYLFVPGLIALLLMLISALMTSITITREKELGTMEILLVSPLRPIQIIVGKVLPYLLLSLINTSTVLLLARFVFEVPFRGSYLLFYAEALLFILTALSLGLLISTIARTQQVAMMASLAGLMLPVIILSGFIFPVSSMPMPLQVFSNIVPAKWFLIIVKGIMLKGVGIEYLWKETLVLAGMTVLLMTISARKFKIRLE